MLPAEEKLRSFGRITGMLVAGVLGFWLLLNGMFHNPHGPQVAPCPPQECVFHPHAPHGPGG